MAGVADATICIPTKDTARVQEGHILCGHMLCDWVEIAHCRQSAAEEKVKEGRGNSTMIENLHRIVGLIEGDWKETHVLVVGDVMLDRYIWGDVERISPEAPVPVVRASHRSDQPGGAANVAMNVAGLGARVTLAGFAGNDADREILDGCLEKAGGTRKN